MAGADGNDGQAGTTGQTGATGTPGTDGDDGASGEDGIPGEDGVGYEFIFTVTAGIQIPSNQRPLNSWGYDQPVSVNGLTWHDAAPNVTSILQYLWRSQRVVVGTPSSGDAVTDQWTQPTIQSRYSAPGSQGPEGTAGTDGEDGAPGTPGTDGQTGPTGATGTPGTPGATGTPGTPGNDGDDGATGTPGTPGNDGQAGTTGQTGATGTPGTDGQTGPTGATGTPGTPGATGTPGTPGNDGAVGDQGVKGDPGVGVEYIFAVTPVSFANDDDEWTASAYAPSNAWGFDEPATVTVVAASRINDVEELIWTDGATALDSSVVELLWRAERPTAGTPTVGDVVSANFLTPVIVHRSTDAAEYLQANPITNSEIADGAINLGGSKVTGVLQLGHIDADVQNVVPIWAGTPIQFDQNVGNKIYIFQVNPGLFDLLPGIPGAENFAADYIQGLAEPEQPGSFGYWGIPVSQLVVGTSQAVPSNAKHIGIVTGNTDAQVEEIKVWRNGVGTKIFMKPSVVGDGGTIHNILAIRDPDNVGTSITALTVSSITTESEDEDYIYYREPAQGEHSSDEDYYIEENFNSQGGIGEDSNYLYLKRAGNQNNIYVYDFEGNHQTGRSLNPSALGGNSVSAMTVADGYCWVPGNSSRKVFAIDKNTGINNTSREFLYGEARSIRAATNDGTYIYLIDTSSHVQVYRISDGVRQVAREFDLHSNNSATRSSNIIENTYLVTWDPSDVRVYVYSLSDGARQVDMEIQLPVSVLDNLNISLNLSSFYGIYIRNNKVFLVQGSGYLYNSPTSDRRVFVTAWFFISDLLTEVPDGNIDIEESTPTDWDREILGQNGGRFYLGKRTRTFQNERFFNATVFDDFEEITGNFTISQYLWRKSITVPSNPSGGMTSENHEPTNYSRTRFLSTTTEGVYRWKRDAIYDVDGDFVSATVWGDRLQTAPPSG